ncbi:biotin synthase [Physocladia obscura]|uniref:biotin synthase n=1 Tax=Physocladia obscura TaxID=109957 RepID=A0AAD5XHD0_9FUNG|nr:biotin synthase [Physocladia obscura]
MLGATRRLLRLQRLGQRGLATVNVNTNVDSRIAGIEPVAVSVPVSRNSHTDASPAEKAALFSASTNTSASLRYDWSRNEIAAIYNSPLMDLLFYSSVVHRAHHNGRAVQQCTLLSIKTGGCSEDCSYCPQSAKHKTGVAATKLLKHDVVLDAARKAKAAGSSRFCMGAAWRDMDGRKSNFKDILGYVSEISSMGMEVCCTLGMITADQAKQLKDAGLTAYNHNLDTSREYYPKIITTRSYDERLETIAKVRDAGINVCSGGIIGLGESHDDRVGMLHTLATLPEHPESVPVNALLAVQGTPLENQEPVSIWEMIRMIGTARIIMPKSMIRLSAGRVRFLQPEQAMCFMAGANSIFTGDKLLTTPNNAHNDDTAMFETLGLVPLEPALKPVHPNEDANVVELATAPPKGVDEVRI